MSSSPPSSCSCRLLAVVAVVLAGAATVHGIGAAAIWGFTPNATFYPKQLATVVFENGDLIQLSEAAKVGAQGLYPLSWTVPRPGHNATHPCVSPIKRFGNTSCVTLRPDFEDYWKTTLATLQPFIANRTVIGVFLGDERMWNGATLANLTYVVDIIRRDWPPAIIYINEAQDVLMCGFNRLNETIFGPGECLPKNLDWFGFDIYSFDGSSSRQSMQAFEQNVFTHFAHGGQWGVPTSTGFGGHDSSTANWTLAQYDAACVKDANTFWSWAMDNKDKIMGIFPWHWNDYGGIDQPYGLGIVDLPQCRNVYNTFAQLTREFAPDGPPHGGQIVPPVRTTCPPLVTPYPFCDTHAPANHRQ